MNKTKIEWCDAVWNPVVGCTKVSPGCDNCYAERMAMRFCGAGGAFHGVALDTSGWCAGGDQGGPGWTGRTVFRSEKIMDPKRLRRPSRIFVCSMGDLFHESVDDSTIFAVWQSMFIAREHTFIILTKRAERMRQLLNAELRSLGTNHGPLPNVWLGVSAENQALADERLPDLLRTPAAIRLVSVEPMLGPVSLFEDREGLLRGPGVILSGGMTAGTPDYPPEGYDDSYPGLDWVICGAETGPRKRPCDTAWIDSLRGQCAEHGVPFFGKVDQNGQPIAPREWAADR